MSAKKNISRDDIANAINTEFGFSRKDCNDIVNDIIDNQLIDKQFSDSNISLVEIEKVKNIFVNKLINVYNLRVEYPK